MKLFQVSGESMRPTLAPGDVVLCLGSRARSGDVVVVLHPRLGRMVKRVGLDGSLVSDSSEGTESSRLGSVADCKVLGRAVIRIGPKGIRRLRVRRPCSPRA